MAAMLMPGMRAVAITISAESGAGGFVLPNDRVDVIVTPKSSGPSLRVVSKTILSNVRVLAVDQTVKQDKDAKTVVGRTATLEVTPQQAEMLSSAQSSGSLSLALRPLGDTAAVATADMTGASPSRGAGDPGDENGPVAVIRYGMGAPASNRPPQQEKYQ